MDNSSPGGINYSEAPGLIKLCAFLSPDIEAPLGYQNPL